MDGTTAQQVALALPVLALVFSVSALLGCAWTWSTSRAEKVRSLERSLLDRSDRTELKLAEWQATMTSILAEVEEFFERAVKERKRVTRKQAEEPNGPAPLAFEQLSREEQKAAVRAGFERAQ